MYPIVQHKSRDRGGIRKRSSASAKKVCSEPQEKSFWHTVFERQSCVAQKIPAFLECFLLLHTRPTCKKISTHDSPTIDLRDLRRSQHSHCPSINHQNRLDLSIQSSWKRESSLSLRLLDTIFRCIKLLNASVSLFSVLSL